MKSEIMHQCEEAWLHFRYIWIQTYVSKISYTNVLYFLPRKKTFLPNLGANTSAIKCRRNKDGNENIFDIMACSRIMIIYLYILGHYAHFTYQLHTINQNLLAVNPLSITAGIIHKIGLDEFPSCVLVYL